MPNDTFICARCGTHQPVWERTIFDGQALCPDCLSEHTITCTRCGTRIWTEDNAGTEDEPLCQHCYDDYYEYVLHPFRGKFSPYNAKNGRSGPAEKVV